MNAQEIFDTVHKHLIEQGGQAMNGSVCTYRDASGKSCAVGCLIPDDLYDEGMEYKSVAELAASKKALSFFGEHRELLIRLMRIHDHDHYVVPCAEWETYINRGMQRAAADFNLQFAPRTKQAQQ